MELVKWCEVFRRELTLTQYLTNISIHAILFEEIAGENPTKILEVGTGSGSMSIFLSHLGYDVTAIDNNEKVLHSASKLSDKLRGNVKLRLCDALELSRRFDQDDFDIVFSQGFFEHGSSFSDRILTLLDSGQSTIPSLASHLIVLAKKGSTP
jgi:protein-L-isoaspartate O-methyltransferase